jgi:hypothetical protein
MRTPYDACRKTLGVKKRRPLPLEALLFLSRLNILSSRAGSD